MTAYIAITVFVIIFGAIFVSIMGYDGDDDLESMVEKLNYEYPKRNICNYCDQKLKRLSFDAERCECCGAPCKYDPGNPVRWIAG